MIRALRPTDLPAFLAFRSRAPASEALAGPLARPHRLSVRDFASRSLAINPGGEAWVQIEHRQIFGLLSAHSRFGTDIWDIDCLMILPSVDADRVCLRLLTHLCEAAVEEGVQKVFLRLPLESEWLSAARLAGFQQYTTEQIFIRPPHTGVKRPAVPGLRPRRPADHQALFQLYSSAVPVLVRQVEGMTLQEWRWTDGWGVATVASLRSGIARRRRDLVVQKDEQLDAWIRADLFSRVLHLLIEPDADADPAILLRRGVAEFVPDGPIAFAVRDYQQEMARHLVDLGFRGGETHALLARPLAMRVPERRIVPSRVLQPTP